MFASRYFGSRFFPARYFAEGQGSPDFVAAIVNLWTSQSALTDVSTALYWDQAPEETPLPYCVISQVSGITDGHNTGRGYWETKYLQFAVYADGLDKVARLGNAMTDALDPVLRSPLAFVNGYQMQWLRMSDHLLKMPGRSKDGKVVWQQAYVYRSNVGRTRPT